MPRISPFQALVYEPSLAGPLDRVTAPPYDVITDRRRREYLSASPFSVVHLDLAEGTDDPAHPESRYARAAQLLADWERAGAVVRMPEPTYFAYEMGFALDGTERSILGLVCAMDLEPWGGSVIPHEHTMPGPVQDRLRLLRATATHLSAVYGTIAGPCRPLDSLLHATAATAPMFSTVDEQGVSHRLWAIGDDEQIATWLAAEPLLMADGHHRYTTALQYREERHALDGPGPWDRVLTLIVDAAAEHLPVLPFHRIQTAGDAVGTNGPVLDGLAAALAACSDDGVIAAVASREAGETVFRSIQLDGEAPTVRALHEELLDGAVSTDELRFLHDAHEAADAVRRGEAVAAYFLPPTTPDRIRAVIDRGERLPQKSTYFWPKPRTGMVMMPLDPPSNPSPPHRPRTAAPPAS
jgi:uncharacterized protein (DUF1015 family)